MAEVKDKDSKQPEVKQPEVKQPEVKQPEVTETAQHKEFITLNGAVRRDLK
jgi:hypothetical protein